MTHICCFSIGLDELTRTQQRDRVLVARKIAEAGRFSAFEATASKDIARTMDAIGRLGWFKYTDGGYPWMKAELTEAGKAALRG